MPKSNGSSSFARSVPHWQLVLLLVGLPALYVTNSFLPWSVGLFAERDRSWYLAYMGSLALLHWGSVGLVVLVLRGAGGQLKDLGLEITWGRLATMIGIPVTAGVVLTVLRENWPASEETVTRQMILPTNLPERAVWVVMSCTAGFCEELVYRGFAIRVLQGRGMRTALAVFLATLAYVFIHDLSGVMLFPVFFMVGLLFSGLFLWTRSLVPGVCLHGMLNVSQILLS